jgi:hypothetical protein
MASASGWPTLPSPCRRSGCSVLAHPIAFIRPCRCAGTVGGHAQPVGGLSKLGRSPWEGQYQRLFRVTCHVGDTGPEMPPGVRHFGVASGSAWPALPLDGIGRRTSPARCRRPRRFTPRVVSDLTMTADPNSPLEILDQVEIRAWTVNVRALTVVGVVRRSATLGLFTQRHRESWHAAAYLRRTDVSTSSTRRSGLRDADAIRAISIAPRAGDPLLAYVVVAVR